MSSHLDARPGALSPCPLCAGSAHQAFLKYEVPILDCEACGHRFAGLDPAADHLARVYDDAYFFGGGAGYPDYRVEQELLRRLGQRLAHKVKSHAQPGRVLDVGCAAGYVLRGFQDGGWKGFGVEPNQTMAAEAAKTCTVHCGTLHDLDVGEQPFDLVTMIQVVGHFVDPVADFELATRLVKPGGFILLDFWNRNSLAARALRHNWHEYSPPSVLHWWSPAGIQRTFAQLGCHKIAEGILIKRIDAAHAKALLGSKLDDSAVGRGLKPLLRLVPDALRIPYLSDDLRWLLLQAKE